MPADLERVCPRGHRYKPNNGCPVCRRVKRAAIQRRYRAANGNAATRKYEKTPQGFLMRAYRNMQSRVTGVQWKKAHLYVGKSLCSREEFYEWSKHDPVFWGLYCRWVLSGYDRRLSPSVDRIDPARGYELGNMQWLTHSENSARVGAHRVAA